jgi:localization factor PodJL
MPDVRKILERVRASQTGNDGGQRNTENERIDYIAAARRAAKAAALETDPNQPNAGKSAKITKSREPVASTSAFARHRRPILMAVGAILLALMAMPLVNTLTRGDKAPPPPPAAVTAPATPGPTSQVDTPRAPQQSAKLEKGSDRSADTAAKPVAAAPAPAVSPAPLAPTSAVQATAEDANGEDGDSIPAATAAASPSATTPAATSAPATGIAVPATITPKALADAAASGDPQALFEIGARYTDGRGVTVDMKEAARWYQLSADRGLAPAQYRLGSLYEKGNGVDRDVKKAIGLYTQAANAGNASAMHNLAVLYASGAEGAPNYKAAVEWFTKASNLGVTDSQFNLAILHARGNGTPQNLDESYKWFAIAAKGGDKDAAQKRDEVAKAMKPDQLANARTKVDTWKPMPIDAKANAVTLPDAWGKNQASSSTIDMGKAIRNIQAILNHKGYDAGQPDGMMGKKTVLAIKAFQRKNGLSDDGNITEELVRKLLEQNATKGA